MSELEDGFGFAGLVPDAREKEISAKDAEIERLKTELAAKESKRQPGIFPTIVCLCGSTRFYDQWQRSIYELTMRGIIVLSVGFYPHSSFEAHGQEVGCSINQKVRLDELHKRKIDLADEVLILNVGGYIGKSTQSELEYAKAHGKRIRFLEPPKEEQCTLN